MATLLLTVGVIANAGAQNRLGSGIRKLFSWENRKVELTQLDYSRFPAFSMSEKNGMTIESIIFDPHPTIVPIEDKIEFTDFSDLPDEYNIWSHSSTIFARAVG